MAIIRSKRPEQRFIVVSKDISDNVSLSWQARGLLIYLLGKPDNWSVSVSHLVTQTRDSSRKSGREAVTAIIGELIASGYIKRSEHQRHDESGYMSGYDYTVFDEPCTGQPFTGFPTKANPQLLNTDLEQELNTPPTSGVVVAAKKQVSSADSATCSGSVKNTTNTTAAARDAMSQYTTTDQPTSRSMVTVDETWRPTKAFFNLLSYTGRRDAELTPELIAKFILENNGQKAMQGTLEKRLLSWVIREENAPRNGSQGPQRGNATRGRRSTNWHSDINNVKHGESGEF